MKRAAVRYFGDYVLLGEIASGGMGVVYRALQTPLGRDVAVKMIHAGKLATEPALRRFKTEAEAMAKLDHPNIIPIYEVGEQDGEHYFSMKLVDGPNLAERVAGQPMPSRQAAELLLRAASAVHYAHQRGVLHRDLKPSNILVDEQGQPHLTDFGIAKLMEGAENQTASGTVLGTPNYMAPEQAAGKLGRVTTAADVYSLGAVLYYLLTAQAPFQADSPHETLSLVLHHEPLAPRSLQPGVDRDLETVCLRCMEKEPAKRYPTVRDLADELNRYLRGEPVHARPITRLERLWRTCRRHSTIASLVTALILVLLGGAGFLTCEQFQRNDERAKMKQADRDLGKYNRKLGMLAKRWLQPRLENPTHVYQVDKTINVLSLDDKPAGTLMAGDLLNAESGQELADDPYGTDVLFMKVIYSRGDGDEVPAGRIVKVTLMDLQEFSD